MTTAKPKTVPPKPTACQSLKDNPLLYIVKGEEWGVVLPDGGSGTLVISFSAYLKQQAKFQDIKEPIELLDIFRQDPNVKAFYQSVLEKTSQGYTLDSIERLNNILVYHITNMAQMTMFMTLNLGVVATAYEQGSLNTLVTKWKLARFTCLSFEKYTRVVAVSELECILHKLNSGSTKSSSTCKQLAEFEGFRSVPKSWKSLNDSTINTASTDYLQLDPQKRGAFSDFMTQWWHQHRELDQIKALEKLANSTHVLNFISGYWS